MRACVNLTFLTQHQPKLLSKDPSKCTSHNAIQRFLSPIRLTQARAQN
jgi:hypothetical protein